MIRPLNFFPILTGLLLFLTTSFALVSSVTAQEIASVSDAPAYAPEKPIEGSIQLVGSTLMQPIATLWMEDFTKIHPGVASKIDCQGSEESFKQLASSQNAIALLSREVGQEELKQWSKELNKKLIAIEIGYDVLAMIVHKDNPIRALAWNAQKNSPMSLAGDKSIETWGELGVDGPLGDKPITNVVIVPSHGLRSIADRLLNLKERPNATLIQKENQPDIVDTVAATPEAIAVVSASRAFSESVRSLAIAVDGQRIISPRNSQAVDLGYPLLRKLSVVVCADEQGKLTPLVQEWTKFVLSRTGQETLIKDGLLPLDRSDIAAQEERLGWEQLK